MESKRHKMNCNNCGQEFDMRDLSQVVAHEECEGVQLDHSKLVKLNNWKDVQEIYPSADIDFTIGVRMFLRGEKEPDNLEINMIRQGYWKAKSDKLNLKYQSN